MFYLLIISVLALIVCWLFAEQNKKKLTDVELKEFRRTSLQDKSWFGSIFANFGLCFVFKDFCSWLTPYPIYFTLTIVLAVFFAIRISVNQAKLPQNFVRIDNILFTIQMLSIVGVITFFDFLF